MTIRTPSPPRPTSDHPSTRGRCQEVGFGPRPMKTTPLSQAHNNHEGVPGDDPHLIGGDAPLSSQREVTGLCPSPRNRTRVKGGEGVMLSGPTRVHGRPQPSLGEREAGRRWHPQDPLGAAQVTGPGAGPLSRTWSPRGPSNGTPPAPRYAARPRAAWQDAPPARGHVRGPSTGLRVPRTPKAGVTPITVEHIPRCTPTRGPADPRSRLHSSGRGQPVARRPLTGLKGPATHLHDAVRGLGCRHLHPSPPASETLPFLLSPPRPGTAFYQRVHRPAPETPP